MKNILSAINPVAGLFVDLKEEISGKVLYEAVEEHDVKRVELLIKMGANVNFVTDYYSYETPLELAVAEGYVDIVKLLIAGGANVNRANRNGWSPLFFAVAGNSVETAKLLINQGANIEQLSSSPFHETPLIHAIKHGFVDSVNLLIGKGAKFNGSHFILALENRRVGIANLLIEKGVNIHQVRDHKNILQLVLKHNMIEWAAEIMLYQPTIPENIDQTTDNFKQAKKMADQIVLRELFLSYASGMHKRLGVQSKMRMLYDDVIGVVAEQLANGDSPSTKAKEAVAQQLIKERVASVSG